MSDNKEKPEDKRERLRQEEIKRNLASNIGDGFNRAQSGSLVDLVGSLGWKGTGILIIVIIVGYIIVSLFFN
ncbi:DUF6366 family protein [Anaerobacillus isosaccharinicus]|uniref:Phage capsid protein n=1 Tax=Anaerobacillus isosaccharinicus TaxID=1532552 RepID=A0A1S2LET8_9BACI|nr:DUF6366 family protein [Anaerobacillus isosaccharinicus]MBA5587138.1 hypothetical protein [Anaerobacillus isosaccharinicus]QOY34665.1 hypothetical protein AWH56_018325 [Anaerobacillus isosaccharinicus]